MTCLATVTLLAAALSLSLGSSTAAENGQAQAAAVAPTLTTPLANPQLSGDCGIDVALQFDTSGSIDDTELAQMRTAAKDFADALTLTPSKFALYHFDLDAFVVSGFTSVATAAGGTTVKSAIDGIDGSGLTNWDAAFKILDPDTSAVSKADLVVVMTDGNPTTHGYPTHASSSNDFDNLNEGIKSANGVKSDGTRIVAVGIGNDLNVANLKLISGPTLGDDYYTTSFGDLGVTLGQIARDLCHSTVSVTKLVNGVKQSDWTFNASGSPAKTVDAGVTTFEWDATDAASRTITEVSRDGFTFAGASCSDLDGPIQISSVVNGISLTLGPTDHFQCTFTNAPHPAISIDKTGPESAIVGTLVTYTITVTNPGALPLHDVTVSDPDCSTPSITGGDVNDNDLLDPGEAWIYTCTRSIVAGDGPVFENTASASGSAFGSTASDEDSHDLQVLPVPEAPEVLEPAIAVVKSGPTKAHVGDSVTYAILISNPGEVVLTDVEVTDPDCSAPALAGGDANTNTALDLSETWTYTCVHVITASDDDPFVNTVTVSGSILPLVLVDAAPPGTDGRVFATAEHAVDIIHPAITITTTADPVSGNPGTAVVYTYEVTNTGDTPLADVSVADDKLGDIAAGGTLDPGESATFTKSTFMTAEGSVTNVATASGIDELRKTVTATDSATVSVVLGNTVKRPLPTTGTSGVLSIARMGAGFLLAGILLLTLTTVRKRRDRHASA